ncbi:MAG: NAD(P)/FAD-dependent oxidoreductase [Eubacteriales bacterium]|nr:NAD(P)/FAD-dependent oxidoreductase [Eubacteriales bacterium]
MDVLVIGGGPAGMMAALTAAQGGARVTLLERNEKLGKKLYITGKGRCNLTNACDSEELVRSTVRNGRFLYSAYAAFDNRAVMEMIEGLGVPLKVERGNRVFPQSEHASDITRALTRALERAGVAVRLRARVAEVLAEQGAVRGVRLSDGQVLEADAVILTTGGMSYPVTGSDGDGHRMAAAQGVALTPCTPSLTPVETAQDWPKRLQGLSLKNVRLTLLKKGKKRYSEIGEMLFTHFGVSGPLVLTASTFLSGEDLGLYTLQVDMKPGLDAQKLDERIYRDLEEAPNRQWGNILPALLPQRMVGEVLALCGIAPDTLCHQVTREQRRALGERIKALEMTPAALRGWEEAIITRGGVRCGEVDPKTMAAKAVKGLFFAGELLDVDAVTGGFNLQIAFSTGYTAGKSAAEAL